MLGFAMMPPWIRNWSEPVASPMFRVESVTLASSVIVFVPAMLFVRLATSPMASG